MQIFDFVFDHDQPIVSIASVIAQLEKYEGEWEKFPRDSCEIAKISNDKLSVFLSKQTLGRWEGRLSFLYVIFSDLEKTLIVNKRPGAA